MAGYLRSRGIFIPLMVSISRDFVAESAREVGIGMFDMWFMSDVLICPIMLFITSVRFDSESRRYWADVTTLWPGSSPESTSV
jgi:hypothetical protein